MRRMDHNRTLLFRAAALAPVAMHFSFATSGALENPAPQNNETAKSPEFDVATIKPGKPGAQGSTFSFTPGEGVEVTNGTLKGIIEMAYDVRDFQITGGPAWTDSQMFDIAAKNAASDTGSQADNSTARIEDTRLRLQALLRQRFQLKIRREMKELPVYVLEVGKKGPKLLENSAANPAGAAPAGINAGCGQMTGTNTSTANLAYKLSRLLDRSVLDRTGLTGNYDFQLSWTPDSGGCSAPSLGGSSASAGAADGPSLFTALKEQLGLMLVSQKAPVEVLVIEQVEQPSPN